MEDPAHTIKSIDQAWRFIIGLGCVPAVVALYFRLTIPETPRFTMDIDRNVLQASEDIDAVLSNRNFYVDEEAAAVRAEAPKASRRDFLAHFGRWENGKVLFGTAYSWFALDVSFAHSRLGNRTYCFPDRLLRSRPQHVEGPCGHWFLWFKRYQGLRLVLVRDPAQDCRRYIILAVGGLIPGYWATFLLIDSWGRKPIQLMGFAMLTALFIIMGKPDLFSTSACI